MASSRVARYKLEGEERGKALADAETRGWNSLADRDAIKKDFTFKNFSQAFGWMTRVALEAEKLDHHPEWFNVYNRVSVTLSTHDLQGLSTYDMRLASLMDRLAADFAPPSVAKKSDQA